MPLLFDPSSLAASNAIPARVMLLHFLLLIASGIIVALAFAHIGVWCALLVWFVLAKMGALRFPFMLLSALGLTTGGAGGLANNDAMSEALRRCDTMPAPKTQKTTYSGKGTGIAFACSSMQGWRRAMEDAHCTVTDLRSAIRDSEHQLKAEQSLSLFSVFDGHSGASIAQFCGAMLPQFVVETESFRERRYVQGLRESYINIDKHLSQHPTYRDDRSGCTAVSILVSEREILCANAGDSRAVLCRGGRALPLSIDHKPTLPLERRRIERAKSIVARGRVNGVLALSRALGDFSFKRRPFVPWEEQAVTCVPDVTSTPIQRDADEFAIVACDGIWDVMSNEQVVNFVRSRLLRGDAPPRVIEQLMDNCLSNSPFGLGCDNMSVVLVLLRGTHELRAVVDKELLEMGEGAAVASSSTSSSSAAAVASASPFSPSGSVSNGKSFASSSTSSSSHHSASSVASSSPSSSASSSSNSSSAHGLD